MDTTSRLLIVVEPGVDTSSTLSSVNDAISRLQREKAGLQKDRDEWRLQHHELKKRFDLTMKQRDWYLADNKEQKLLIQSLQDELDKEAEFDEDDDPKTRRIRREYEKRMVQYEVRMHQLESDMQKEVDKQVELLKKAKKESDDAREEANDAQRGAITMFNEQKRYDSHIERLQSDVHRMNNAVDKMRDEEQEQ
jgi:chromosome segregation ATPase